jgi:hypothetical protein
MLIAISRVAPVAQGHLLFSNSSTPAGACKPIGDTATRHNWRLARSTAGQTGMPQCATEVPEQVSCSMLLWRNCG